jgi:hypothetical protein
MSPRLCQLRIQIVLLVVGWSIACHTPAPATDPAPLGPRATIHDEFTMEHPATAMVKRYSGSDEYVWMIKDHTFEMHIQVNMRPPFVNPYPEERRRQVVIDGHDATIRRYEEPHPPWPYTHWVQASFPASRNSPELFFMANCADPAAQDLIERMLGTIRFLP